MADLGTTSNHSNPPRPSGMPFRVVNADQPVAKPAQAPAPAVKEPAPLLDKNGKLSTQLSNGTQLDLSFDQAARKYLAKNFSQDIGPNDSLPPGFVSPELALKDIEDGIRYVRSQGLTIPKKLIVKFTNLPGSGSNQRSGAYGNQIDFDISEGLKMGTVVHELVHVATPKLCTYGSSFLSEGIAYYLEQKFDPSTYIPSFDPEGKIVISGKVFYRSHGNTATFEEGLSYDYGRRAWELLVAQFGQEKMTGLLAEIEAQAHPAIDTVFIKYTGHVAKFWLENLAGHEASLGPDLRARFQSPDTETQMVAVTGYAQAASHFSHDEMLLGVAALRALIINLPSTKAQPRNHLPFVATTSEPTHCQMSNQATIFTAYKSLVKNLSTEETQKEATAWRKALVSHNDPTIYETYLFVLTGMMGFDQLQKQIDALRGLILQFARSEDPQDGGSTKRLIYQAYEKSIDLLPRYRGEDEIARLRAALLDPMHCRKEEDAKHLEACPAYRIYARFIKPESRNFGFELQELRQFIPDKDPAVEKMAMQLYFELMKAGSGYFAQQGYFGYSEFFDGMDALGYVRGPNRKLAHQMRRTLRSEYHIKSFF